MPLTRIVSWSHVLAREILRPGDLAVDLTAGRGRDTRLLAETVGLSGQVLAFDIQPKAEAATKQNLQQSGYQPVSLPVGQAMPAVPGIFLVLGCHSNLFRAIAGGARVVMANLGYLPGGDRTVATRARTTLAALEQALQILERGGRLIVTTYPGHAGGGEEESAVSRLLAGLPGGEWQVLQMRVANHAAAPGLIAAEKHR